MVAASPADTARFNVSRRSLLGALGLASLLPKSARATTMRPGRVAALDWGIAATMIAIGPPPLGVPAPSWYERVVGDPPLPPGIVDLGLLNAPSFELLQSLAPTLILIPPTLRPLEPLLGRIARVETVAIASASRTGLAALAAETSRLGGILGLSDAAETFVARAGAAFDADKEALSTRTGEPLVLLHFLDDRHIIVFGPDSLYAHMAERLGFRNGGLALAPDGESRIAGLQSLAEVSMGRVVEIGSFDQEAPSPIGDNPLLQALPFVRDGRINRLPPVFGAGGFPAAMRFSRLIRAALVGTTARHA